MRRALRENPTAARQPLRVLLVEHSAADVELCLLELKRAGFEPLVHLAEAPEEFAEKLSRNSYDIVLADYRLPNWTGMEALELFQRLGKEIPFLLVTGTLGDEAAVECIKKGATDYVLKDRLARLPLAVRRALEEKALREERTQAERALRQSEASFRLLFADNPLPMWVYDAEALQFLQVNDSAVAYYGYSREEFLRMRVSDLWPPEESPRGAEVLPRGRRAAMSSGPWRQRLRDGRIIEVEVTSHTLEFGGRLAVLEVAQDITERKRAEEALRHSEARYREMFENAIYGIYCTSPSGKFLEVNPALVQMLGYDSKADLLAQDVRTSVYRHPEDSDRVLQQYLETGRMDGAEVEWKRKDGSVITVRLSGRAVNGNSGNLEGLEVIAEDVTERRAMERHFRGVQKFEAIGQLAGGIAHDFNNVIGAIMGWAEMGLEQARADEGLRDHFRRIFEQAERAAGLTQQLLAFARRQILEPRNISLNQAVADLLSLLEKVIGKDIELRTVLAPDLTVVRCDPTQIEQVLMNLCLNARDAMPRGGRLVIETQNVVMDEEYCRRHSYARPGPYALLSVSDTGVGMDTATMDHIFEPFFTTKEKGKGTGLGLATVYGVVKQHGGFLHVYSEPSHGSVFRIYFPAGAAEVEKVSAQRRDKSQAVRGGTETILVAEDHDGLRDTAQITLESLGYRVLLAKDGLEALEVFHAHRDAIALALLDVVMPKLGGPEAYRELSAARPNLPVLFTTGYTAETASLEELLQKGTTVLQKPYSPRQLGRKVREILDRAANTAAQPPDLTRRPA